MTDLGSSPVTAALALATAIFAAVRRRPIEAVSLVAGWLIVFALVHITKIAYDRARPPSGFVDTFNAAFPSGHSAYAVALVACATVLVRAGVGWAARIAAVTVAVVIVAVVGVTRVYLRAHFLTDVLGGIALAVAIWSLVGVFALVRRTRSSQCREQVMTDDEKTYLIAGAAAAISLIAWLFARRRARVEVLLARPRPARGDAPERLRPARSCSRAGVGAASSGILRPPVEPREPRAPGGHPRRLAPPSTQRVAARLRRRRLQASTAGPPRTDWISSTNSSRLTFYEVSSPARKEAALPDLGALSAMSDAVESGLGLPEVVRAAARALDASLVLIDRSSSVLAVAARSTADERSLMRDAEGVETHELRVGDAVVGRLRLRAARRPAVGRRSCGSRRR